MAKHTAADHTAGVIQWHPAFFQAMQMELAEHRNALEFKYEYQLTTEPLRIDLLIIKKPKEYVIDKNIARIFRAENVVEFKSPGDYVSIKDFWKVYAYATLYAAITPQVDLSDMTITFVETRYPKKLIQYLTEERHYTVEQQAPGIYTVSGDYIPIQIIESKKLSERDNLWLKSLTNDLEAGAACAILEEGRERLRETSPGAYLEVLLRANPKTFLEVRKMLSGNPTFEEVFTEAGIIPEWIERGIKQGLKQGREQGIEQGIERGREQGIEQGKVEVARNLLRKGWTPEGIAEITNIPIETIRALAAE